MQEKEDERSETQRSNVASQRSKVEHPHRSIKRVCAWLITAQKGVCCSIFLDFEV